MYTNLYFLHTVPQHIKCGFVSFSYYPSTGDTGFVYENCTCGKHTFISGPTNRQPSYRFLVLLHIILNKKMPFRLLPMIATHSVDHRVAASSSLTPYKISIALTAYRHLKRCIHLPEIRTSSIVEVTHKIPLQRFIAQQSYYVYVHSRSSSYSNLCIILHIVTYNTHINMIRSYETCKTRASQVQVLLQINK